MPDTFFIGVDSGSQSTKVSMINQRGEVVSSVSRPLRPILHRQPGWVEHPEDDLWDSLQEALKRLLNEFDGDHAAILGLGLCAIRCCRVFLKPDGSLQAPVMSWMDVRAYERYEDDPSIGFTGSTSGYLTFRLTGRLKDTIANAHQNQFPVDTDTWQWSEDPERLQSFQIPREKLLEAHLPGEILGYVSPEAAQATGLPVGLPVVSTANDKAVEALGSGLINQDLGLLSLGTYTTAMVLGSENRPPSEHSFTNLSAIPYRYLYESNGIRGGMWHISWFKSILGEEFAESARSRGCSVEEALEAEAAAVPAGSEGLMILPDWLAPATELFKKGVMIGFDQRHTRGHIYRAFMEALTLRSWNNFAALLTEIDQVPKRLVVCGGGSNSPLFMQIVADVFGIPTVRNLINGAAALGAAISATVATGYYESYETAVSRMVHEKDAFPVDPERHATYTRINERAYRDLPATLDAALRTIHQAWE